jgi:glycosyltransferase involved in cell wall biosynthesis
VFCSTVIPTIGRPTLNRTVTSLLEQAFTAGDFEIIVVNDSGQPLPAAAWQSSPKVTLIETNRRERSVARNAGASLACGRYLHFLDDDDWMAPGALDSLWKLAQAGRAEWLYGATQLVNRQGKALIQLQPDLDGNCFVQAMAGEWIPLQASLVEAEQFFALGGFNPRITGPEDNDLLRRFTLHGAVAGTSDLVTFISWGDRGSTTPHDRHARDSRWARERILNLPGVFKRMRASARSSYLRGRVVRAFLTSGVWNVQHKRPLTAASRTLFSLAAIALTGAELFSLDFWRMLGKPHDSPTFRRGRAQAMGVAWRPGNSRK